MCNCRKNPNDDSCCCCKYEEIEFDKDRQCFCYCYQENTLCYWINKYFVNDTQKTIISCMILYFIGRLSTIGCQNKYEIILRDENIFNDTKAFFAILGGVFLVLTVILFSLLSAALQCPATLQAAHAEVWTICTLMHPSIILLTVPECVILLLINLLSRHYILQRYDNLLNKTSENAVF